MGFLGRAGRRRRPLIPAWDKSRAVANFVTAHGRDGNAWVALGAWMNVLSRTAVAFLPFHFRGEGRLPRRDLAHVRPDAVKAARIATREFAAGLLNLNSKGS